MLEKYQNSCFMTSVMVQLRHRIIGAGGTCPFNGKEIKMAVHKNTEKNYWEVSFYYKDYRGIRIKKHTRGFKTKREALEWQEQFKAQQAKNLDMNFKSFVELYYKDMDARLRESSMETKKYIVEMKIIPYFGERKIAEITAADIRNWQNELLKKGYKPTYLKTINNQLNAIFNYAVRYYDLSKNPCSQAGSMGKSKAAEMNYWTKEEFDTFLECVKDKEFSYYGFQILFWTGIRAGELLALTPADVNLEEKTLNISKSLRRMGHENVITEPKTEKSKRVITLPDFLVTELEEYFGMLYGVANDDLLFPVTKAYFDHEMKRGIRLSGVKEIRLHDLRHSHASLLISNLGVSVQQVAERLGHEKITTTLETYSHLYPNQARELADKLNALNMVQEN